MGWLDHDRLGFNYRLSDIACAIGIAQLGRLDELLAARAASPAAYREALRRLTSTWLALPSRTMAATCAAGLSTSSSCRRGRPRRTIVALRERGVQSKPYLPAIHLMCFYRERFGRREGEFPVCEDVPRAHSRCRSSRQMTEGQVTRVVEALETAVSSCGHRER